MTHETALVSLSQVECQTVGISVADALEIIEQFAVPLARVTGVRALSRLTEYVVALRKSPELVALIQRDIDDAFGGPQQLALPASFSLGAVLQIVALVRMLRNGTDLGTLIPAILDLLRTLAPAE